jgi:MoCo/4Fe-4S cofactor protein with predicted Tat translocation signal
MATEKQYWLGLEDKEGLVNANDKEFGQDLPALSSITEGISTEKTGRRDFLKMLGFSVTAAAVAASCEMPVRKSIPYTIKPEEIVPGVPNYYASAYIQGGNYNSVLVKTREGRPILVEGNNESAISQGGVNPKTIGSLLSLYDNARIKNPMKGESEISWSQADSEIAAALDSAEGKVVLLSSTIISPSTRRAFAAFQEKYPNAELVEFDAISYSGLLDANETSFGKRALASLHFDKADLIVSVGADFLGTWVSPTEYAASYAKRRKVSEGNYNMNRHIQIESLPSLSGSNADLRIPVKPSEEDLSVLRLYNLLARKAGAATVADSNFANDKLSSVADELWAAKGKSIVISGSNNKNTQLLVNAINDLLGNYNSTIDFNNATLLRSGDDNKVSALLADMNAGKVSALFVFNANPAYVLGDAFAQALSKVSLTVDFSERDTETTALVQYVLPTHHYLESWDDAQPKENVYATVQPTIAPLFNTRQAQESLLKWAGVDASYYDFIRETCRQNFVSRTSFSGLELFWNNVVHDGEVLLSSAAAAEYTSSDLSSAASAVSKAAAGADLEIKLYEKIQIGDGTLSDNPWMQELADPITRITWDNYIVANPTWVKEQGLLHNHKNKSYNIATVTVNGYDITLPVVALPGVPKGVLGVAYGYGRFNNVHSELKRGVNVYPVLSRKEAATSFAVDNFAKTGDTQQIAIIQQEHKIEHQGLGGVKTRLVVKETTLDEYKASAASGNLINEGLEFVDRKKWVEKHLNSLYGTPDSDNPAIKEYGAAHVGALAQGHHWGMGVDLNSCIGCGACVVACNAENNVPVVGRNEVRRAHDMNWLRIDKYHTGDDENPQVIFQPMMCQHCDNAPCENVCPVAATNHSTEGLNQMTYNRCIGTRYCANNCPYKVRRFNWYDYQGADSFSSNKGFVFNNDFDANDKAASFGSEPLGLHSPLAKMVLNPDVTVRSRGVIEKCSFCVQRIQLGKLEAKKAKRGLKDSDIVTACQSACPTNAITFGDTNNPESAVSKVWADPRAYGVIEEIHTLPSVRYLVKVRNQKKEDLEA